MRLVLTQQGGESRNGRLDAAVTLPAEVSSFSGATPSVWKDESAVLMRSTVWLARGSRGIAGGEHKIVKAAQGEASQAALRRKAPERRIFCVQSARACFGGIFRKLTTRAAPTLAMAV